jgi:hypothetical protein
VNPFSILINKAKLIIAAIIAALLPILYIIGRRDGAKVEEVKQVKASAKAAEDRAEFYQEMEKANNEIQSVKPRNRDELTKRLRDHGL